MEPYFFIPGILSDNFIILSFEDYNQLCFVQFTKKMDSPDVNRRKHEKLSCLDFKVLLSIVTVYITVILHNESLALAEVLYN